MHRSQFEDEERFLVASLLGMTTIRSDDGHSLHDSHPLHDGHLLRDGHSLA
jgi:hypothetical protein